MDENTTYKETVISRFYTGILIGITTIFIILGTYFSFKAFNNTNVIVSVSFFILAIFFVILTLASNRLSINVTKKNIKIGFILGGTKIGIEDITNCYEDEVSHVRYGSWGIRLGHYKRKWRIIYSTPRMPRLVLSKTSGIFKEVVFSTKNPKQLQRIIKSQMENKS